MFPGAQYDMSCRVLALEPWTFCPVGDDLYIAEEIRLRVTPGGIIGGKTFVAGKIEKKAGMRRFTGKGGIELDG